VKTNTVGSKCYEFYFSQLDTLLQVENAGENVTVRATQPTFSPRRQEYFVRELAAEAFIPDRFRWFSYGDAGVRWIVDRSWIKPNEAFAEEAKRRLTKMVASAGFLWLFVMGCLVVSHAT
jgi:hypothetical protein